MTDSIGCEHVLKTSESRDPNVLHLVFSILENSQHSGML